MRNLSEPAIEKEKEYNLSHFKRLSRLRRSISDANKIALLFRYFWDTIFDKSPTYCFGCGEYIETYKRNSELIIKPYKKESIHVICWNAIQSDDFVKRLNEESRLICSLDLGWGVHGSICRSKVKNTPYSIMVHMINHHGWNEIAEIPLEQIKKEIMSTDKETLPKWKKAYLKGLLTNPEKWFLDNELICSDFRNTHFLKPNGKNFPKVRDY